MNNLDIEASLMRSLTGVVRLIIGAAIVLVALMNVADVIAIGMGSHHLLVAFGWELVGMIGVYVFGRGAFLYLQSEKSRGERPTPPDGQTGPPSAESKVRH